MSGSLYFPKSPFSPCGRWAVLAGKVYHVRTGIELFAPAGEPGGRLNPGGWNEKGPVWFSPDGRLLAGFLERTDGGGTVRNIAVWELASGKILMRFPGSSLTAQVVFASDGRTIALANTRGVSLHDLLRGNRLVEFSAPDITFEVNIDRGAGVQTVSFSPDGRTLATGHQDGSISLWAVPQTEAVKPVKGDVSSC